MFTKFSDPSIFMNEDITIKSLSDTKPSNPSVINHPPISRQSSGPSVINHPPKSQQNDRNIKQATDGSTITIIPSSSNNNNANHVVKETLLFSKQIKPINVDIYKQIVKENMDLTDINTIQQVMNLNEAEQNTLLLSLTNKLYQMIIGKVSDIDYGDIPSTKGNITKLPKYKQIKESIEVLHNIFVQYKEKTEPVDVINTALSNLEYNSDLFMASYAGEIDLGIMTYENVALGIVTSLGYMISVCIEYIKNPKKEGLDIILNKSGIVKVKDHIVYENLAHFNEACKSGDIERALRPLIKNQVKNLTAVAVIHIIAAIPVVVVALLPFLKQMVYFFYATKVRMSSYLDAQADLLEMNAAELQSNDAINTEDDRKKVIARQLKIAGLFHDVANKISIDSKEAEQTATKELKNDGKGLKIDQVETNPGAISSNNDDPLF